jgi:hypothetical protein
MDLTGTFDAGAKSVDVSLRVIDGSRPAVASLYIEDIGGHDTLLRFAYDPPFLSSVSSISYSLFGKDTCKTVFVRNPLQVPTTLTTLSISGDSTFYISNAPLLPATIAAGDSLPVTICFGAGDTSHHTSLFTAQSLCGSISLALQGRRTNGPLAVFNRLQRNTDVSFELIPNPARSNVVAHVMSGSPGELEIYSILGARISETEIAPGVRDIPLSLQSLPRGTYIVRLTTDTGTISRRLEIQ